MNRSIVMFSYLIAGAGAAAGKDPAANPALEASLRSEYEWTNADGRTGEIIRAGRMFTVRKEGISTNPADAPFHAQNNYRDGVVKQSALNLFAQDQSTAGRLVSGDRVFITKTEVKDTSVVLNLLSVEPIHGIRVKASLAFPFQKGVLAMASFEQVARVIDEVLAADSPPEAPFTLAVGAGVDQVIGAMGEPPVVASIHQKLIFLYPELKVTFLDGKVIDVK